MRRSRRTLAAGAAVSIVVLASAANLGARADRPSRAVYPRRAQAITFSHASHTEASCETCHAGADASARSRDSLTPGMEACASCHAEDAEPALSECSGCHQGYDPSVEGEVASAEQWLAVRTAPMIPKRPPPNLHFSHAAHAGQSCASCHGGADAPSMPLMQQCASCHAPQVDAGPTAACASCHPSSRGGPITTEFSDPATGATLKLEPDDHTVDWITRHGPISRSQPDDCASCHTEASCADCHQARGAKPMAVHPPNFVAIHSVAARADQTECRDCHDTQTFCMSCHVRAEAVTAEPDRPPPRRTFHPPGWRDLEHGAAARRNIDDCASCHQERDCVSCHQGINPHPDDFTTTCASWLDANPEPCLACHTETTGLCR